MKNKKIKDIKVLDLFAGCGGLTSGFVANDFKIAYTIEKWQPAINTYNLNFKTKAILIDITNNEQRNIIKKELKNVPCIIGGFPCQGFSLAGKRSQTDPRNQLYNYVLDFIKDLHPQVVILENVKGILSYKEQDGKKVIEHLKEKINRLGYYLEYILLDTSLFNVPQKRQRVIFIASKNKDKVQQAIKLLQNINNPIKTVYDAISDLENVPENKTWSHIFTKHSTKMLSKIKNTKTNQSAMQNFRDAFRRIDYFKPSPTIKENHGGVHIHPTLNRVLTPRECARLQSFSDDFMFCGSKSDVLKQIGNAVPPEFSKIIAKIIRKVFFT